MKKVKKAESREYRLYDPVTVMFFFRNKHMMIDLGTGNNNKVNWAMNDKQEFIDIVETIYRGARKGRGLVMSPKDAALKAAKERPRRSSKGLKDRAEGGYSHEII